MIDVGYSGVIGAQRIASGEAPWGHFPVEAGKPCSAAVNGTYPYRIQANGRCEAADPHGDTYGPVAYEAYLPGYAAIGWKGKGDDLDAARFTSILFDVLAMIGLALVGRRFGGWRLAATLAFAWAAYPFTQYVSSSNTNDAIQPVLLIFGFWLATSAPARGIFSALAGWTKFARAPARAAVGHVPGRAAAAGRAAPTLPASSWPPSPCSRSCCSSRTRSTPRASSGTGRSRTQIGRDSPFSLWDWRQYHAGLPDLHVLQYVLAGLLVAGALLVAFVPRRKSPLQLAALSAALLLGFEVVLTHWFYAYIAWFFPFFVFAVLSPAAERVPVQAHRAPWTPGPRAGSSRLTGAAPASRRSRPRPSSRSPGPSSTTASTRTTTSSTRRSTSATATRSSAATFPTGTSRSSIRRRRCPSSRVPSLIVSRGASQSSYDRVFGFLMAICGAAMVALVALTLVRDRASTGRLTAGCALAALAPLALGSVLLTRFDLWPAALVAAAIAALVAGRDRLALGSARPRDRGEDLPGRPAPDLRRLRLEAARETRGAGRARCRGRRRRASACCRSSR